MQFTLQNFEQLVNNNNIAKLCKYFKQCQLYLTNIINNAIYIAKTHEKYSNHKNIGQLSKRYKHCQVFLTNIANIINIAIYIAKF